MELVKPEEYRHDLGRSLPPDEFIKAARESTHISQIKRPCQKEGDNARYRAGKTRG